MTKEDIYDLLKKGEHLTLECKKATNAVPNSVWETYSAFANTYGGVILLGISENLKESNLKKRFAILGVEDPDKIKKDLWNMLNNPEKTSCNIIDNSQIDDIELDGRKVVYIVVPRAEVDLRPVYINGNPLRGSYKRNHEGDFHMSQQEIRMMLRDANSEGNDQQLMEYYTMEDIDIPSLESYRNRFSSVNPDHVWVSLPHKEFLTQLGCYKIDRKTRKEGLTLAGLLMFGKGLPIRERFNNLRMDYIDKSNLIGDQRYSDRLTYDGTWENNLYNFITMVLPKLQRELPRPFKLVGNVRVDDTPQHKALREAFTNAIIHADLLLEGALRVVKYDNRYEFTNPGLLKLPIARIYGGDESRARNQNMQALLRMIGFGEGIGSGFPLILSAWEEKDWTVPQLIEEPDLLQVKLILSLSDNAKQSGGTNGGTSGGTNGGINGGINESNAPSITARQKLILSILQHNPKLTVKGISEITGDSKRTIERELSILQNMNILKRQGPLKKGEWIVSNLDSNKENVTL